jgi:hypothetical protein
MAATMLRRAFHFPFVRACLDICLDIAAAENVIGRAILCAISCSRRAVSQDGLQKNDKNIGDEN